MADDGAKLTRRLFVTGTFGGLAGGLVAGCSRFAQDFDRPVTARPPIIIKGTSLTIELHRNWGDRKITDAGSSSGRYQYQLDTSSHGGENTSFTVTVIGISADGVTSNEKVRDVKKVALVLAGDDVSPEDFYVTFEKKRLLFDCKKRLLPANKDRPLKWAHEGYSGAYFRIKEGTLTRTKEPYKIKEDPDITYFLKIVTTD